MKLILSAIALSLTLTVLAGSGYKVGDKAMDFKLKNIDGNMMSLKDHKDAKGFIVIFTCNHCPYSKLYEDRIIALNDEFAPKGYPVIAINPNDPEQYPEDSYDNMKVRAENKGFTFPYLLDDTQEIAKAYGASRTPHVFLVDNKMIVRYIGAIDDNARDANGVEETFLVNALNKVMEGAEPDPDFTKAIGCSIKWKQTAEAEK